MRLSNGLAIGYGRVHILGVESAQRFGPLRENMLMVSFGGV